MVEQAEFGWEAVVGQVIFAPAPVFGGQARRGIRLCDDAAFGIQNVDKDGVAFAGMRLCLPVQDQLAGFEVDVEFLQADDLVEIGLLVGGDFGKAGRGGLNAG